MYCSDIFEKDFMGCRKDLQIEMDMRMHIQAEQDNFENKWLIPRRNPNERTVITKHSPKDNDYQKIMKEHK